MSGQGAASTDWTPPRVCRQFDGPVRAWCPTLHREISMTRPIRVVLLGMCVVLVSGQAAAQEQGAPRKSGSTAFLWSFAGTAVPWVVAFGSSAELGAAPAALVTVGMLAGPSLGHFYAGRPGRALASS